MSISYRRHRFPPEIISYCVWLYYTFPLSYRDFQKMMLYRGIKVTYEAIRYWCRKFAQPYANAIVTVAQNLLTSGISTKS